MIGVFGRSRSFGPAICGLHVRNDPRPEEYGVLRFYALRSIQSKPRLLQGDGFGRDVECAARFACDSRRACNGRRGYSRVTPGNAISRRVSLGLRGTPAFASRTLHASRFPPDLTRLCSSPELSLLVSLVTCPFGAKDVRTG